MNDNIPVNVGGCEYIIRPEVAAAIRHAMQNLGWLMDRKPQGVETPLHPYARGDW